MIKKDIDRMDRLLADGWRNPGGLVPGDDWKASVMSQIRSTPQESPVTNGFSRVVLRVSLAAAAAAVALVAWTVSTGFAAYQDLAMKLLEDPASMLFSSPFV
jgi:mannose/fructose/N-acetylgalactosamine-specific phosphotransferase system component IIC